MQLLIFLFLSWFVTGQPIHVEGSQISPQEQPDYRIALSNITTPSFTPTEDQLEIALDAGVSLFEIDMQSGITPYTEKNFSILYQADISYPTLNILETEKRQIVQSISNRFLRLSEREQNYIAAVGLFRLPADYSSHFRPLASSIADSISGSINKPLYYHSFNRELNSLPGFSFVSKYIQGNNQEFNLSEISSPVIYFEPSGSVRESLSTLSELMEITHNFNESLIILPSEWFYKVQSSHPSISTVLKNYTEGRFVTMPLPRNFPEESGANPSIIFLLLIFAALITQYKYQPVALLYAGRYFFNHPFFMNDIMDNRIRSVSPGLTFLVIHSVVNGLFFLTLAQSYFSDQGLSAFSLYFVPEIAKNYALFWIFATSAITALVLHTLSVLWLRILNRQINTFSKAINLYIWPFFFTLIPVSLLVFNLHTLNSELLALILSVIYLLTWLISFASASINAARRLEKYRSLNLFFTVGLYSIIFSGLCTALMMVPSIYEPLELALKLP